MYIYSLKDLALKLKTIEEFEEIRIGNKEMFLLSCSP